MAHDLRLTVARRPSPPAPFFFMPQSHSLRRPDREGWAGSPDALTETATERRLLSPSAGIAPAHLMSPVTIVPCRLGVLGHPLDALSGTAASIGS